MSARFFGASFLLIVASYHLAAQPCTSRLYPPNSAGSISVGSSDPHISAGVVAGGVGMWQTCSQSGSGFPSLVTNGNADMSFGVVLVGGISTSSSGGCGQLRPVLNGSTGQLIGGTIELFDAT